MTFRKTKHSFVISFITLFFLIFVPLTPLFSSVNFDTLTLAESPGFSSGSLSFQLTPGSKAEPHLADGKNTTTALSLSGELTPVWEPVKEGFVTIRFRMRVPLNDLSSSAQNFFIIEGEGGRTFNTSLGVSPEKPGIRFEPFWDITLPEGEWVALHFEFDLAGQKVIPYFGPDFNQLVRKAPRPLANPVFGKIRFIQRIKGQPFIIDDLHITNGTIPVTTVSAEPSATTPAKLSQSTSTTSTPVSSTSSDFLANVAVVPGFSVTGSWQWSGGLKGPAIPGVNNGAAVATLWSQTEGVTATWAPRIGSKGRVKISVFRAVHTDANDPKATYIVEAGGETKEVILDFTKGQSGWAELGIWQFDGSGKESVTLKKVTPTITTRASAVLFEILDAKYDAFQTRFIVNADNNADKDKIKKPPVFNDLASHPNKKEIETAVLRGVMKGKNDKIFDPEKTLNYKEFLKLFQAVAAETIGDPNLSKNIPAPLLQDDKPLRREAVAVLLMNAWSSGVVDVGWEAKIEPLSLPDEEAVSSWAKTAVEKGTKLRLFPVNKAGEFVPAKSITRADAAIILKRYQEAFIHSGPPQKKGWELAFQDEFNGNSVDWKVWWSQNGPSGHIMSSRYPENCVVSNGILHMVVKKEQRGGQEWTAASIQVKKEIFEQTYGYWECRYRYIAATGLNQSWWMYTDDIGDDKNFELDINEGHWPNEIASSIHVKRKKETKKQYTKIYHAAEDLSENFNVIALEWTETELIHYLNGKEISRLPVYNAHSPVRPYLSLAVINWAGPVLDSMSGKSMDVDWVRVWKKKP